MLFDERREQPPDEAVSAQGVRDYQLAPPLGGQLRRRRHPREERADRPVGVPRPFARRRVDCDDALPRVARDAGDARLEERPGRGGLPVRAVPAEAREDVPEVRGDDRQPGEERGLGEGVRGEAAPAPLVLHLVEDVLAVAALAVEGQNVPRVRVEVGDERVPLVGRSRLRAFRFSAHLRPVLSILPHVVRPSFLLGS